MMKVLILLACVTYALADVECNSLRRLKVKKQWNQAYGGTAKEREEFAREIFDYLFDHVPESRKLFARVRGDNLYSAEFAAHMVRLLGGVDLCVSLFNEEETLKAELAHLKVQHDERNIVPMYFDKFEEAMFHAVPRHAKHFDQDAWHACYKVIVDGIRGTTE